MDPWLESRDIFPDLHNRFINRLSEALNAVLPRPFFTTIANRSYVDESDRMIEPDVNVYRQPLSNPNSDQPVGDADGGVLVQPVVVTVPSDEVTEWYLELHAAPDGSRLVTSVEVLSRSNKRRGSTGRRLYRKKQRELLRSRINTVEIDLLRAGLHTTSVPLDPAVRKAGRFDYHVCVHRAVRPEDYEVYPTQLSQRLPSVRFPLSQGVDIPLDLQPIMTHCYEVGLYEHRLSYDRPPDPPLTQDQQTWAVGVLKTQGIVV
jgi:hypothetical protein